MQRRIVIYDQPLEPDELEFLERKDEKDTRQFYRIMKIFMLFSFIIPFGIAWFRVLDGTENPFSMLFYFASVAFLLAFSGFCSYLAYRRTLQKIKNDIRDKTKTIEQTHITRKQYMPHDKKYYFYLDSPNKLSIEVSEGDYYSMHEGDEMSIEYSTHARLYLGYF